MTAAALPRLLELANTLRGCLEAGLVDIEGRLTRVAQTHCDIAGLSGFATPGDLVEIEVDGNGPATAEILSVDSASCRARLYRDDASVRIGACVRYRGALRIAPHESWKGRTLDALARPIDGHVLVAGPMSRPVDADPPDPLRRARIHTALPTGVRAVDVFTPLCAGQRIGLFAGSGVGKSTLLAMMARAELFDAVVVALVGERGREVRDWLDDALALARAKTIAVVATGDESAMMRRLAPRTAMTIAETLRDRGETVLLIVDSITRYAHALREIGLAAGEPPVARGYPPSVFGALPRLLERAGPGIEGTGVAEAGSITGMFSVLVDGDDHDEPVADAVRGALDGHIVLSRAIAKENRFPALDPLTSVSRLAHVAWSPEQRRMAGETRRLIARYEESRDLRAVGGWQPGHDAELDHALAIVPRLYAIMTQMVDQPYCANPFDEISPVLQGKNSIGE